MLKVNNSYNSDLVLVAQTHIEQNNCTQQLEDCCMYIHRFIFRVTSNRLQTMTLKSNGAIVEQSVRSFELAAKKKNE